MNSHQKSEKVDQIGTSPSSFNFTSILVVILTRRLVSPIYYSKTDLSVVEQQSLFF